jgi:RNA polymerase sigma-70 factor (ECF subfamily)
MAQTAVRMDESALIRAAQAGDQRAFEQLVRQYDRDVLRLALNLLRSQEDANDIYQEAFLRVFRNLHSFRFDCSFHTWLYRIVTNLCLDALRKRRVRKEETTVVETSDGVLDRMDTVEEPRADGDPQRQLMSRQLESRIREVLQGLTARERMVFELRHFQGLRLRAIGEMLGTTEEAAKNCLFRATQKMRAALGDFV